MRNGIHLRDARGPDGLRIYAIGDVHGRLDLLTGMHRRIHDDIARGGTADWRIVHLGDYIDRGPDSKGVIDFLVDATRRDARNICLCGNHDAGLLDFLAEPSLDSLFVRYGGVETARSYGVGGFDGAALGQFHRSLLSAVPEHHLNFIAERPASVGFGDFFLCHAGVRPEIPLDRQVPDDLMWMRRGFLDYEGLLEKVVVHGHTIVPEPEALAYRINVDTGAYHSNRLTALKIDGADREFLTAGL
ncbi:MAG: serine/threonine protein phosphatase [Rhizobiaceae bacterium]|nr:serine/threonine protein phosphatase [Rhizobiaceae bacterium]